MTACLWAAAITIGLRQPLPMVIDAFPAQTCVSPRGETIAYRLYVPPSNGQAIEKAWPLVIWFHGRGEAGTNNLDQLAWLELIVPTRRHSHLRCLVLAVQAPSRGWAAGPSWRGQLAALDRVAVAWQDVCRRHQVDLDRVYLAGISQGADACLEFAGRFPRRIAGMLIMAACPGTRSRPQIANIPTWQFQSTSDDRRCRVPPRRLARWLMADAVRITDVKSTGHDCWTAALRDHHALRWLLRQRRGQPPVWPSSLALWVAVCVAASGILGGLVCRSIRRRGGTRRPATAVTGPHE